MAIKLVFNGQKPQNPTADETRPTFKEAFLDGLIFNNLSLIDFVGLTPIIAGGSTVINGLILSAATMIVLVTVTMFALLFGARIGKKLAPAVYTLLSAVIVFLLMWLGYSVIPGEMLAVGIVFPLVAVNGITLNRVRNYKDKGAAATFGDALGTGLGFAVVMFAVEGLSDEDRIRLRRIADAASRCPWEPPRTFYEGLNALWFIREILGYGTFFNISLPFFSRFHRDVVAGLPGGFFIMAVLALLTRFITLKRAKKRQEGSERE